MKLSLRLSWLALLVFAVLLGDLSVVHAKMCTSKCLHPILRLGRILFEYGRPTAMVMVSDENNSHVVAAITGVWTLPDGSTREATMSNRGVRRRASFSLYPSDLTQEGDYTFQVTNIVCEGYTFDPDNAVSLPVTYTV